MGVSRVARDSALSALMAEIVADRSALPRDPPGPFSPLAPGSGVPSSAARAQTRSSSGEQLSGRSPLPPSRATPSTSQSADSSGDDVDRATPPRPPRSPDDPVPEPGEKPSPGCGPPGVP